MENLVKTVRPSKLWALPILMFAFVILGQILSIIPVIESGIATPETLDKYPYILMFLFGPFSITALLGYMWIRFYEREQLTKLGIGRIDLRQCLRGAGTAVLMGSISVGAISLSGGYIVESHIDWGLTTLLPVLLLLLGFCIQASVEECIFRGWIFHRINASKGIKWGIAGNAVLFTLMHLMGFDFEHSSLENLIIFCFMLLLFSVFLSLMTLRTGSVWWACGWHILWNWLFINAYGLPTTGLSLNTQPIIVNLMPSPEAQVWLSGGTDGPENSIVTLLVFTLAIWLIFRTKKRF